MSNYNVSEGLYRNRVLRRLSQQQVADILHIGRVSYMQIEHGINNLTLENAVILADFYDLTVDELILRSK